MLGKVASSMLVSNVGFVVGPPRSWLTCPTNIGESTGADNHVDNIDRLATDWVGNGEPSARQRRGEDGGSKVGFLTNLAATTWRFVETFRKSGGFGNEEGVISKNRREIGQLPVSADQCFPWQDYGGDRAATDNRVELVEHLVDIGESWMHLSYQSYLERVIRVFLPENSRPVGNR